MRSPTQSQAMQKEIKHTSAGPALSKSSPFVRGLSNQSMRNIILEKISQLSAGTPSTFTFRIRYLTLAQVFPHSMQLTWPRTVHPESLCLFSLGESVGRRLSYMMPEAHLRIQLLSISDTQIKIRKCFRPQAPASCHRALAHVSLQQRIHHARPLQV